MGSLISKYTTWTDDIHDTNYRKLLQGTDFKHLIREEGNIKLIETLVLDIKQEQREMKNQQTIEAELEAKLQQTQEETRTKAQALRDEKAREVAQLREVI